MKNGNYEYKLLYSGQLSPTCGPKSCTKVPIARLNDEDRVVEEYVYGSRVNVPEYMIKDGRKYRFITDHRGSVRMVVDTHDGTVMQRTDYDEFGLIIDEDLAENWEPVLFGYAGGLQDRDTGLIRFGARDYDPMVGRWTSKEPLGFNGSSNFYVYAENDPVNRIDFNGFDWLFFDGRELFWYNDNNEYVDSFAAVSGPHKKGAIPDGFYNVYLEDSEYLGNNGMKRRSKDVKGDEGMVCEGDDYGWSVNIDDPPGRDYIRMHPDGGNFGTYGCIEISCKNDDYLRLWGRFVDYAEEHKTMDLYVLKLYDRRSY